MRAFTYRLSQVPGILRENDLRQLFPRETADITVISRAPDPYPSRNSEAQTITITFQKTPSFNDSLSIAGGEALLRELIPEASLKANDVIIDNHFQGLTPLNSPNEDTEILAEYV
jgi:hypothetical protein